MNKELIAACKNKDVKQLLIAATSSTISKLQNTNNIQVVKYRKHNSCCGYNIKMLTKTYYYNFEF